MSAPDTTTPAPYSSDTHEDLDSSAGGESPDCPHRTDHLCVDCNDQEAEELEQVGNHSNSSKSMAHSNGTKLGGGSTVHPSFEDGVGHYATLAPINVDELTPSHQAALKGTDDSQGNSSTVTSDTEYGGKQTGKRKKKPWKPNSDMSTTTGPHSTETSDVETSANEQSTGVAQKGKNRKLGTLFFGLTFGLKSKDKGKDKGKGKTKDKAGDGSAGQPKSRFSTSSPGTLKKPNSEPHLVELEEPIQPPVRGAITPDLGRHSRVETEAEVELPVSEPVIEPQEVSQQQTASEEVKAVALDSVPSTQSPTTTGGTQCVSKVRTIQERIAILQQQGVRTESDTDSQGAREHPVLSSHNRPRLTSAEDAEVKSSMVMKTIQLFEGHSTHSSGQAQPRKSSGQDGGLGPEKLEGSDRKSSNSSAISSDTSASGPVKPVDSPQPQPERKQEEVTEPTTTTTTEDTATTAASPLLEQDPSLEVTVKSPSGCEDLTPPAVPLKYSRSQPTEDEEDMKVFARLQAAAARARKDQPPIPAPYREGRKALGAERSQQTMPSRGSQSGKGSRSAYTLPAEKRNARSRSPSPPPLPRPRKQHPPVLGDKTVGSQDLDHDGMAVAAARPKPAVVSNGTDVPAEQQPSSNSLSQSEPNLLDTPSSPPAIPTRQESRVMEKSNTSPYRSLNRHAATNLANRAASVDSCLDERSSKSLSPQQDAADRETSPGLPTLGDDLTTFMDEALSRSFNSTDFEAAQVHEDSPAGEAQDGATVERRMSRKPTRTKSERALKRHSVGSLLESSVPEERARLRRTPSMDVLNDRADRQSRHFFQESSSEDEEEGDQVEKEGDAAVAAKCELGWGSSFSIASCSTYIVILDCRQYHFESVCYIF